METVRILCFGDSLTAGYSQFGMSFKPYADNLKSWLRSAWPMTKVIIEVSGLSGDRVVSGSFLSRIKAKCDKAKAPYDWIIILGGTNDLGYGYEAEAIFEGLEDIYTVASDHGAKILALTVPECYAVSAALDERRDSLNAMIKEHEAKGFYALDLHALMPYHTMSEESRKEIWDDGLHFTPDGYGVMGDHIANRLVTLVATIPEDADKAGTSTKAGK